MLKKQSVAFHAPGLVLVWFNAKGSVAYMQELQLAYKNIAHNLSGLPIANLEMKFQQGRNLSYHKGVSKSATLPSMLASYHKDALPSKLAS